MTELVLDRSQDRDEPPARASGTIRYFARGHAIGAAAARSLPLFVACTSDVPAPGLVDAVLWRFDAIDDGGVPVLSELQRALREMGDRLAPNAGIMILSPVFNYPPDYVARSLAAYRRHGHRDVVPAELRYSIELARFRFQPDRMHSRSHAAHLALGCFTAGTLLDAAPDGRPLRFLGSAKPFRTVISRELWRLQNIERFEANLRDMPLRPDEHQIGFEAAVYRQRRAWPIGRLPMSWCRAVFARWPGWGLQAGRIDLRNRRWPAAVERAVQSASPPEIGEALLLAVSSCRGGPTRSQTTLVLQFAAQYASAASLLGILRRIDTVCPDILAEGWIRRVIGDRLIRSEPMTFMLAGSGLTEAEFLAAATPETALLRAVTTGDRDAFLSIANLLAAGPRGSAKLARLLRTHTQDVARFAVRPGEIEYATENSAADRLCLAIVLNDAAGVERELRDPVCAKDDALVAAWRTRLNDYRPLNAIVAAMLRADGAAPIRFDGDTLARVLESVGTGPALPDAADHGLVSVIVAAFNPEPRFLELAVRSVLAQTYRRLELILVDDGSDATSAAAIRALADCDPRIRAIRNERNAGPYHCRNLALQEARGDFVAFHDSDDVAHPQRLQLQIESLLRERASRVSFSSHIRFDEAGGLQFEINPLALNLIGDGPVTAVCRRSLFDAVGAFAPVRSRGDIEMRLRVAGCFGSHSAIHLRSPLMYCSGRPGSLSHTVAARYPNFLTLLRQSFNERRLPPLLDGERLDPKALRLVIPFVLSSRHDLPNPSQERCSKR